MKQIVLEDDFTQEDHETWKILFERQMPLLKGRVCKEFWTAMERLEWSSEKIPSREEANQMIMRFTDWKITRAEEAYLDEAAWGRHMARLSWPMTDYIRSQESLDFTPNPDAFHDFFGHLPQLVVEPTQEITRKFGELYNIAGSDEEKLSQVSRLWWHTMEFGLKEQDGETVAIGAGHFSSNKELLHAMNPELHQPFDLKRVIETPGAKYDIHSKYFVLESWEQLFEAIEELKKIMK